MTNPSELMPFINALADAAANAIMPHFRAVTTVESKAAVGFDPVTAADRAGEAAMRGLISRTYPDHGVIGEEYGSDRGDAEYVWVLDPIDGTRAFITGVPVWGILIGLLREGRPILGMMHQPFLGERFVGDGANAWYSRGAASKPLSTRRCAKLSEASLFTTNPRLFEAGDRDIERRYRALESGVRLARYGCDCYAFCMVAMGHADIAIETNLQPYDIAALIPIVEGAGGRVTSWQGEPAVTGGNVIATGDARLHEQAVAMLAV
jgi:histidinol phosphatase-like enzyme (inositol monophosphatase family)